MATATAKKITFFVLAEEAKEGGTDEILELNEGEVAKRTDLCELFVDKESAETRVRERVVGRAHRKHREARRIAKVKREREAFLERRPDMIPKLIAAKKGADSAALARDPTQGVLEIGRRAKSEPEVLSIPFAEAMERARELADENEARREAVKKGRKASKRKKGKK